MVGVWCSSLFGRRHGRRSCGVRTAPASLLWLAGVRAAPVLPFVSAAVGGRAVGRAWALRSPRAAAFFGAPFSPSAAAPLGSSALRPCSLPRSAVALRSPLRPPQLRRPHGARFAPAVGLCSSVDVAAAAVAASSRRPCSLLWFVVFVGCPRWVSLCLGVAWFLWWRWCLFVGAWCSLLVGCCWWSRWWSSLLGGVCCRG